LMPKGRRSLSLLSGMLMMSDEEKGWRKSDIVMKRLPGR
jgi:hypothetical protein